MARHQQLKRGDIGRVIALAAAASCMLTACKLEVEPTRISRSPTAGALNLEVVNGRGTPVKLMLGKQFYIHAAAVRVIRNDYPDLDVIDWIATETDFNVLDWTGAHITRDEWFFVRGAWEATQYVTDAEWMKRKHAMTLEFLDETDTLVAGPINIDSDAVVTPRPVMVQAVEDASGFQGYGSNGGNYPPGMVVSGGDFLGDANDIYSIQVDTEGDTDGTAMVTVHSLNRDDNPDPLPVVDGAPIPMGASGATITFNAAPGTTFLEEGDKWIVRCFAAQGQGEDAIPAEVGDAKAAMHAVIQGVAEVRLQVTRLSVPEFTLPETVRSIRLWWSEREEPYTIPVEPVEDAEYEYGLQMQIEMSPPENGSHYVTGETVKIKGSWFDGAGNRLHDEEAWPTYNQYKADESAGIQYYNGRNRTPCVGVLSECDLTFARIGAAGPLHRVTHDYHEPEDWWGEYWSYPDMSWTRNPSKGDLPIVGETEFEITEEMFPGTYMAYFKGARRYNGEYRFRIQDVRFQVKTPEKTEFISDIGNCRLCHIGEADLSRLRHGSAEYRLCKFCHHPSGHEPFGLTTHKIHYFSQNYPKERNDCTWCHLTPQSNNRPSKGMCGGCHGEVHEGEPQSEGIGEYDRCGQTCHGYPPAGHVPFPPQ